MEEPDQIGWHEASVVVPLLRVEKGGQGAAGIGGAAVAPGVQCVDELREGVDPAGQFSCQLGAGASRLPTTGDEDRLAEEPSGEFGGIGDLVGPDVDGGPQRDLARPVFSDEAADDDLGIGFVGEPGGLVFQCAAGSVSELGER